MNAGADLNVLMSSIQKSYSFLCDCFCILCDVDQNEPLKIHPISY